MFCAHQVCAKVQGSMGCCTAGCLQYRTSALERMPVATLGNLATLPAPTAIARPMAQPHEPLPRPFAASPAGSGGGSPRPGVPKGLSLDAASVGAWDMTVGPRVVAAWDTTVPRSVCAWDMAVGPRVCAWDATVPRSVCAWDATVPRSDGASDGAYDASVVRNLAC